MPAAKTPTEGESPEVKLPKQEEQFMSYLDEEIAKLESVENRLSHLKSIRAAMTGEVVSLTTRAPRRTGERKKDRLAEFIGVVNEHPGITISDAAKQMGCAANYVYRLKTRGLAEGMIRVDGSNVFPAQETPVAA